MNVIMWGLLEQIYGLEWFQFFQISLASRSHGDEGIDVLRFMSGHGLQHVFLQVDFGYASILECGRFLVRIEPR